MNFVKANPNALDLMRSTLDAYPAAFPAVVILLGMLGAWIWANWSTR